MKKKVIYLSANLVMHYLLQSILTRQRWSDMMMTRSDENEKDESLYSTVKYNLTCWEENYTHFLIVEDEEQDDFKHEQWNVESSFMQRDASSVKESARLNSSRNHAFLRSNACICEHAQWKHDTCKSSLCSDDERSDSIRSSDHDDLTYISIY